MAGQLVKLFEPDVNQSAEPQTFILLPSIEHAGISDERLQFGADMVSHQVTLRQRVHRTIL